MKFTAFVQRDLVSTNLKSSTKESVISEIVDQLYKCKRIRDKKKILESLLKRETLESTGIGNGVAIPHARVNSLKEAILFFGISKNGVDFFSVDNKPVHLIVLFLTPVLESSLHIKILSKIGTMLNNKELISELMNCSSNESLFEILKHCSMDKEGFIVLNKDEIYLELETNDAGITETSAQKLLGIYGLNKLTTIRHTSLILKFIYNFTNFLAILMWIGSGRAFFAEMFEVSCAIIIVIFINAIFSFWQEYKAEKAINALKELIPSFTRVIREGKEKKVPTIDLVPGDIIIIEEGDKVPADARLIEADELRVDNSAFSGESKLSHKIAKEVHDRKDFLWLEIPNLIFAGTNIATGVGKAVVIATGMTTEIGKIAYLTQSVKGELSPLQKEINRLTKLIAVLSIAMGFVFFFVGLTLTKMSLVTSFMFAIGIILANVPEGLMPTVTLALSMAVRRMAKKNALIKKLSSVETLGCTNVICTDKTGTLTTNQMSVKKIWINNKVIEITGNGYEPMGSFLLQNEVMSKESLKNNNLDLLVQAGLLCNTSKLVPPSGTQRYWTIIGDPTEGALLTLAHKAGFNAETERVKYPTMKRFPFESVRKRMSSIHMFANGRVCVFVKGAPTEMLEFCNRITLDNKVSDMSVGKKSEVSAQIDNFAEEGLRVLGFAYREFDHQDIRDATAQIVEKDLIFIGITAEYDPPRPEVKDAVTVCKKAGIRVVMITGDYQLTALSIAKQIGIVSSDNAEMVTGADLSNLSEEQLKDLIINKQPVFARVNPEHKLRIVNAFKELGSIVAVTGDGVNDAPALKRADIGVAMGLRGTGVAKESAEMVLIDDNFASIVAAIQEGRAVFDNIKKFITYIFAHLIPEAVPFVFYVLLKIPVPITAMQILAIDLGTETLPALALGIEKPEHGIMDRPPGHKKDGIIDKIVLFRGYVYLGLLNTVFVLAAYYFTLYDGGWRPGMQLELNDTTFTNPLHLKAMTILFAGIVVMQIANVFACRSDKISVFKIGFFNNKLILWGIVFELIFTAVVIYVPFFQKIFNTIALGWKDWGILFVFMILIFMLEELRKYYISRRPRRHTLI